MDRVDNSYLLLFSVEYFPPLSFEKTAFSFIGLGFYPVAIRAGAENLNNAISENLLPFKVREDIRMEQKNEKKSKKKSLTSI